MIRYLFFAVPPVDSSGLILLLFRQCRSPRCRADQADSLRTCEQKWRL